jgi:hypothetical protein
VQSAPWHAHPGPGHGERAPPSVVPSVVLLVPAHAITSKQTTASTRRSNVIA